MDISRQTAVKMGFHFPFYTFQETIFGTGQRFGHTAECQQLQRYYSTIVPAEMQRIFVNPSFTLEDLVAAYRKYPGEAKQEEELWLNEQLHKALYGLPEFVYRWFRFGQAAVTIFTSATSVRMTLDKELGLFLSMAANCGLRKNEQSKLADLFLKLFQHFALYQGSNPFEFTGNVSAILSELAVVEDNRASGLSKGSLVMKLLSLVLMMLIGLSGFYILETHKAIMWLLFVIIAIPPLLAVLFE